MVGGPDAGESTLLVPGRYLVGRHPGCDIVLGDPTVSRRHAQVVVGGDWQVTDRCARPKRRPPILINGEEVEGSLPVGDDDVVTIGRTRLSLRRFECAELRRNDRLGQVEFQRTPYRPPVVADRPTERVGPVPRRPETRRFQLLAVLAPLAAGMVLYAFSRQLQFLALTLVSPVVMIANVVDDRRSGRRSIRDGVVDFRDQLVRRRRELERLRAAERVERLAGRTRPRRSAAAGGAPLDRPVVALRVAHPTSCGFGSGSARPPPGSASRSTRVATTTCATRRSPSSTGSPGSTTCR